LLPARSAGRLKTYKRLMPQVMLLYNNVAELRQFHGGEIQKMKLKQGVRKSSIGSYDLNIQIPDFLAQSIPVNPEEFSRPDLVATRRHQRRGQ